MRMKSAWRWLTTVVPLGVFAWLAASPVAGAQKADWTSKLEPKTRAMEVCNLAGLTAFGRDKKLKPRPDRVRVNAGADPKIEGSLVSGASGAVRSGRKWYAFTFKCTLNAASTGATAFTYQLGSEIPKAQFEKRGLWD